MSDKGGAPIRFVGCGVPPLQAIQPVLHFRLFAVNHREIEILRARRPVFDALRTVNTKALEMATEIVQELAYSLRYGQTMEHEVFTQTLLTFENETGELPKAMNNMRFSDVLELWKERVVNRATSKTKRVLGKQYDSIRRYSEYRNALVHGMWDWDLAAPEKITTTRIRKKEVITTHFTASDLEDFSWTVAEINFALRYPRGPKDLVRERMRQGFFLSRAAVCVLTGHPMDSEFRPALAAGGELGKLCTSSGASRI
jgi:hypothetical protein